MSAIQIGISTGFMTRYATSLLQGDVTRSSLALRVFPHRLDNRDGCARPRSGWQHDSRDWFYTSTDLLSAFENTCRLPGFSLYYRLSPTLVFLFMKLDLRDLAPEDFDATHDLQVVEAIRFGRTDVAEALARALCEARSDLIESHRSAVESLAYALRTFHLTEGTEILYHRANEWMNDRYGARTIAGIGALRSFLAHSLGSDYL